MYLLGKIWTAKVNICWSRVRICSIYPQCSNLSFTYHKNLSSYLIG